jgi:hypothetical protein
MLRPPGENHGRVLEAARHKTKREVEEQIARLTPRPDARPLIRKVPTPAVDTRPAPTSSLVEPPVTVQRTEPAAALEWLPRAVVAPTAPDRYLIKVTVSAETHAKLRRAQDLLRHSIPNGDHAAVLDRALTLLVDHLERQKAGLARSARPEWRPGVSSGRIAPRPRCHPTRRVGTR